MTNPRSLDWPGCLNVRDLGGLRVTRGGTTRMGAVVRADHPANLTPAGWSALRDYGIRTVVSLETATADAEFDRRANHRIDLDDHCPGLAGVRVGIEDGDNGDFMAAWAANDLWGTPLYFADALARWPQRHAEAVSAVATADPGGVLIHCRRGRDRTGILALLLLAVAGVAAQDIADDYALSATRLAPHEPARERRAAELLRARNTTAQDVVCSVLRSLDVETYLRSGGLDDEELAAIRRRLVAPNTGDGAG